MVDTRDFRQGITRLIVVIRHLIANQELRASKRTEPDFEYPEFCEPGRLYRKDDIEHTLSILTKLYCYSCGEVSTIRDALAEIDGNDRKVFGYGYCPVCFHKLYSITLDFDVYVFSEDNILSIYKHEHTKDANR